MVGPFLPISLNITTIASLMLHEPLVHIIPKKKKGLHIHKISEKTFLFISFQDLFKFDIIENPLSAIHLGL